MLPLADDGFAIQILLILIGAFAVTFGCAVLSAHNDRTTRKAIARRTELILPREDATTGPTSPLDRGLVRATPRGSAERERREALKVLSRFGVPPQHAMTALAGLRLFAVVAIGPMGYLALSQLPLFAASHAVPILLGAAAGGAGYFTPTLLLRHLIRKHAEEVMAGLSDALELMVICAEAGIAFEDGIDRVAAELRISHPALAEELALTSADLKILPSRSEALANLAERVGMLSIKTVTTALSQTLRYGTPLAQALRTVAAELRNDALMQLEERANQLPSLMTIPMMLFIMPTTFMIVGGPAALNVIDILSHR